MNDTSTPTTDFPDADAPESFGSIIGSDQLRLTEEEMKELGEDSPELLQILAEIEEDAKKAMMGEEDNPLAGEPIGKVIKAYLECIPQGIRWLSQKSKVPRKLLERYLDGDDEAIPPEKIPDVIQVIMDHRDRDQRNMAKQLITTSVQTPMNGNRAERRKAKAMNKKR